MEGCGDSWMSVLGDKESFPQKQPFSPWFADKSLLYMAISTDTWLLDRELPIVQQLILLYFVLCQCSLLP